MSRYHDTYYLRRGDTWELAGTLHYANDAVFNLGAGAEVKWTLIDAAGAIAKEYDLTNNVSITSIPNGTILVRVPATETTAIPAGTYYDELRATDPDGFVSTQWEGQIEVPMSRQEMIAAGIVIPNVAEFRRRFPEFGDLEDGLIEVLLTEAATFVTSLEFSTADRRLAAMHLAAHAAGQAMLARRTFRTSSASNQTQDLELFVKSVSFGDRTVQWDKKGSSSSSSESASGSAFGAPYKDTTYGRLYLAILRRNVGGPVVV